MKLKINWHNVSLYLLFAVGAFAFLARVWPGVGGWFFLVLLILSGIALVYVQKKHMRCPGCKKTYIDSAFLAENGIWHCPKCGTKVSLEDDYFTDNDR